MGRNTPSVKANSGRQPGVFASQIHTNYRHCGLFALPVTLRRASLGKKTPTNSIIMSGQMEILAQLKASDPNLGAMRLDGVEVMMKGVRGTV